MNNVTIIGQIEELPQLIYNSKNGDKKLYKFVLKVPRSYKTKDGQVSEDYINVKVWNNVLGDEYEYFDQSFVGVEGKLVSFGLSDSSTYGNELVASKIVQLN
ncbi:single-stranded DNA-binding protein [Spiroplasma helicoides]|uniref:Single-stranded DNA-binding protein n=1 Tax=Spiroplasma helicoides TaxID=216938 RepID=A0A1B3SJX6_9MOLU|nr:single-stranded DNA-binding protein [Spiroplasma helicoides]AOG60239.1 single-stranded DNA-binding protein [Spiroplasma helicoides]